MFVTDSINLNKLKVRNTYIVQDIDVDTILNLKLLHIETATESVMMLAADTLAKLANGLIVKNVYSKYVSETFYPIEGYHGWYTVVNEADYEPVYTLYMCTPAAAAKWSKITGRVVNNA